MLERFRPYEHLQEVVEAGGRLVEDVRGAHDELGRAMVECQQLEVAVVFDARVVEVGEIASVVDDPLRVGVREADAGEGGELERRLTVGRPAEVHAAIVSSRHR